MKILFFISSMRGGGAERVCNTLANGFHKRGGEVHVSYNMDAPIAYTFERGVKQHNHAIGLKTTPFWSRFLLYRFLRTLYNMRRIAKEVHPDFVIGVMTDYALFSLFALAGLKLPIIVAEHTNIDRMHPRYKLFYRMMYPRAAAITVLTRRDYKLWKKIFPRVVYMPNPLSVKYCETTADRKKWVLGVGRVGAPEKGFDSMVKSWNLIYKKHPEWTLVIAGKCEDKDINYLCGFLDQGRDSQIKFLGFRTDVYEIMKQSEAFVLSSRYEGLPMGLMEAMSAGCCCVAFDVVTGPSDIIHSWKSGILVENQNVEELANTLDKVLSNDVLRHKLADEAPNSIKRFDEEKILNRWEILFDLLGKNKK